MFVHWIIIPCSKLVYLASTITSTGIYWYWNEHERLYRLRPDGHFEGVLTFSSKGKSRYNCSMAFADRDLFVLSNGYGLMVLYRTEEQEDPMMSNDIEGGIVMDVALLKHKGVIKIFVCCIVDMNEKKQTRIIVLTYSMDPLICIYTLLDLDQKQEFVIDGVVDYIHIESSGDYINIISENPARLTFDSLNPNLYWSQTEDFLTVWLKIPETYEKSKPAIKINSTSIYIKFEQTVSLRGLFPFELNSSAVVWSRKKDILKLELLKKETGQMWNELLQTSTCGKYLPIDTLETEIYSRLAQSCPRETENSEQLINDLNALQQSQLNLKNDQKYLRRIHLKNYVTTHVAALDAQNRLLFTDNSLLNPLLLIRQDQHACIWQINDDGNDWSVNHLKKFPNFVDVESEKIHKKFCLMPPGCGYIAIVDHSQYAFIYEKPARTNTVGTERIVDLGEEALPIIGAVATNDYLMLLTRDKIYKLHIAT